MKRIIIAIVIISGIGGVIGYILTSNKKENEAKTAVVAQSGGAIVVKTKQAGRQPLDLSFTANGNFIANQDLSLLAEATGRVTAIYVTEGSRVSKGQVLAAIDRDYVNLDVQRSEDELRKLNTDLERYKSAYATGGVTKAQLDDLELAVRKATNALQQSRRRLSDTQIKAPISGVINSRSIEVGSYVSPGNQLFEIVDVSRLRLSVTANEAQVVHLRAGQPVSIRCQVFPDAAFSGKVSFIAEKPDNTLNYPVEVTVDNDGPAKLRLGMYASAVFELPEQAPRVVIPRSAFVGSVNSNQIYVLANGNTASLRNVVPGRIIGEQVEIVSGLGEVETVIISGQINLTDGARVEPQSI